MANNPHHFLLICETCKASAGADSLRAELENRLPSCFAIRGIECMAGCLRPTTVGFQAAGKAQYLFGDINSARDVNALAVFARQYRDSEDGWTNASDRPRALFNKTLSRIPRIEPEVAE